MSHHLDSAPRSLRFRSPKKLLMGLIVATVCLITLFYSMGLEQIHGALRGNDKIRSFDKTWTWSCEKRQCIRREWPSSNTSVPWQSLSQCRITCGTTSVIWPKPTVTVVLGHRAFVINPNEIYMQIQRGIDRRNRHFLREAFDIFKSNLDSLIPAEDVRLPRAPSEVVLRVTVFLRGDGELYLTLDTNESYRLELEFEVTGKITASIVAHTVFGARHALETLSQCIWWETNEAGEGYFKILNHASVADVPRFNYRGIMIDTSRNFIPITDLRNTINGMAASKLNTLHLHLTDSQSFSFDSPRFPQMSRYGAYSAEQVYSAVELSELTEYARLRGVRIIPEMDAPAHAGVGWQWGEQAKLGKLAVCINEQPWSNYCGEPPCGQLNPTNNNTYKVLRGLYQDLIEITQLKDMFHIGGDEVNMNCWISSEDVFPDIDKVEPTEDDFKDKVSEFHRRAYQELTTANNGKAINNVIVWSSPMGRNELNRTLPQESYIIQEWGASTWDETRAHLSMKYRVILSHVDAWYLDCGFGSWLRSRGEACGPISSWQKVYKHRPWHRYTAAEQSLVLGGEVCLWSEKNDEHSVDARVWPRAAALAERLWSDPQDVNTTSTTTTTMTTTTKARRKERQHVELKVDETMMRDAMLRLAIHRERLLSRGVRAEVLWPRWCNDNPDACA